MKTRCAFKIALIVFVASSLVSIAGATILYGDSTPSGGNLTLRWDDTVGPVASYSESTRSVETPLLRLDAVVAMAEFATVSISYLCLMVLSIMLGYSTPTPVTDTTAKGVVTLILSFMGWWILWIFALLFSDGFVGGSRPPGLRFIYLLDGFMAFVAWSLILFSLLAFASLLRRFVAALGTRWL